MPISHTSSYFIILLKEDQLTNRPLVLAKGTNNHEAFAKEAHHNEHNDKYEGVYLFGRAVSALVLAGIRRTPVQVSQAQGQGVTPVQGGIMRLLRLISAVIQFILICLAMFRPDPA